LKAAITAGGNVFLGNLLILAEIDSAVPLLLQQHHDRTDCCFVSTRF